jgi:hypothetical protein
MGLQHFNYSWWDSRGTQNYFMVPSFFLSTPKRQELGRGFRGCTGDNKVIGISHTRMFAVLLVSDDPRTSWSFNWWKGRFFFTGSDQQLDP